MWPILVVVGDELAEDQRQGVFIPHDEVVQALAPQCPDDTFHDRVRSRRPNWRRYGVDADASCALTEVATVDSIAIT